MSQENLMCIMDSDDLKGMRNSIEAAKICATPRTRDPHVAATLRLSDDSFVTACRGEHGDGEHAEFTLLHKKLRSTDLTAGTTLYSTLEPCTHRNHDKRPCADWIIEKKIKRVFIGMLDPNPTICGKGYWKLVNAGVEVQLYPEQLVQELIELNREFLSHFFKGPDVPLAFLNLIRKAKDEHLRTIDGMGWGDTVSLLESNMISTGWGTNQLIVRNDSSNFIFPGDLEAKYGEFYRNKYVEYGFANDGEKFMLVKCPFAYIDTVTPTLCTKSTIYSRSCYTYDHLAKDRWERNKRLTQFVVNEQEADFAHNFCLHMIIVTRDRKIVLCERSKNVGVHKKVWSVSAEEQLARQDFQDGESNVVSRWSERLLNEELNLKAIPNAYNPRNIRVLSVFIESGLLNPGVCAYVEVNVSSEELFEFFRNGHIPDRECKNMEFLGLEREAITKELLQSRRVLHPTSRYRLLLTFVKNFGFPSDEELASWQLQ